MTRKKKPKSKGSINKKNPVNREFPLQQAPMYTWQKITTAFSFISIFVLYLVTLAPTIPTGDSGELITTAYTLGISHPPGYPLFNIIGKLFSFLPIGSIAWRVNLSSAVFNLLAAYYIYLATFKLTHFWPSALCSALFFALSPLIWEYSLKAEVFPLNNFFAALIVYLIIYGREQNIEYKLQKIGLIEYQTKSNRIFYLILFVCGLALTNHHTIILFAPALILYFCYFHREQLNNARTILLGLSLLLLGLSIYIYLPIRAYAEPYLNWDDPKTFKNFITLISRADYGSLNLIDQTGAMYSFVDKYKIYILALYKQFNPLGILLALSGIFGLIRLKEKSLCIILLTAYICSSFIFITIANVPTSNIMFLNLIERFYMLPSVLIALFIGVGLYFLNTKIGSCLQKKHTLLAIFCLNLIIFFSLVISVFLHFQSVTQRNNKMLYHYALNLFNTLEKNALIITQGDINTFPLNYLQLIDAYRSDVIILTSEKLHLPWYYKQMCRRYSSLFVPPSKYSNDAEQIIQIVRENFSKRPIYFTNLDFSKLPPLFLDYQIYPMGIVYKVFDKNYQPSQEEYVKENKRLWNHYNLTNLFDSYLPTSIEHQIIDQYAGFHFALAWNYGKMNLIDASIEEYTKAIELDPEHPAPYKLLGDIYAKIKNEPEKAIYFWKKYIRLNSNDPENQTYLSYIHEHQS